MKNKIWTLIPFLFVFTASAGYAQSFAKVVRKFDPHKGISYRYSVSYYSKFNAIYVNFGESCQLGRMLQTTGKKIENEKIAILENKGDWIPNLNPLPGIAASVDVDSNFSLSYFHLQPEGDSPVISKNSSKDFEFYVTDGNSEPMLNLPICIRNGKKEGNQSLLASEEEWENSDLKFDLSKAYEECIESNQPGQNFDPAQGDYAYQCTHKIYTFIANTKRIQFLCVLEKRLENRLSKIDLNKDLEKLRTEASQKPNDQNVSQRVSDKKSELATNIRKELDNKARRISDLKADQTNFLISIPKACKK